jgi:6-phosphogluconate dehydrogenase
MYHVFDEWNKGPLEAINRNSRDIVNFRDTDGEPLLEKILDSAGQVKHREVDQRRVAGTGSATGHCINRGVFTRALSALKD